MADGSTAMALCTLLGNMVEQTLRFLRAEIIARWAVDPDCLSAFDGTRTQLAALLRNHFGFSNRRASAEANEFFNVFDAKLQRARDVPALATPEVVRRSAA